MSKIKINFLTILIGFSQIYAWATTYYLPATLIKLVPAELGCSTTTLIGGFSWALLIGGLYAPRIGRWIELEGGRRPLFTGSMLMGLGLIILSNTHGLFVWYLAWTVIGLGMALGLFNAIFAAIGRLLGQDAKTIIIRITLISGFATILWPALTYLIAHFGWHTTVFLCAIPHLIFWAPLYLISIPKEVPEHQHEKHSSENLVALNKVKIVFYLLAIYSTLRAMIGTTISVDILTLFQGIGLTAVAAAMTAALIGPSQIAGRLGEMFIGRNFNPVHSSLFWTAVLPLAIFSLIFIGPVTSPAFAIAYGMSNGVLTITMGILPMILFGSKGYATLLGKLALPVLIAQAAAPLLIAPLIESWPANSIFLLAGIISIIALVCLLLLSYVSTKKQEIISVKNN